MARSNEIQFVTCRTFRHAWDDAPPTTPSKVKFGFVLRCTRCATERHDEIDRRTGELVHRYYVYPTDYKYAGDGDSPTMDELRLTLLKMRKGIASRSATSALRGTKARSAKKSTK